MPTLTISGTIAFPLAAESTPPSRTYSYTLVYTEKSTKDLTVTGIQADVDLLNGITDAKAVFVECLTGDGTIEVNSAVLGVDIAAAGGWFQWANPAGGLTELTVTTTADATFRVYVFS
ncbi:hypothetical protein LCGC14_1752110 [marine sediment metagenome]|uniref:Uncharacterized protein n=1 Tax=marine sediment metagenome TaxID=412755 RepID=A0A0F9JIN3_9ZZZZ